MNKIYLIGMPGSGKTTLGKKLAIEQGVSFADLDAIIELKEGRTIREIFKENGESHFRDLEAAALRELAATTEAIVVATGGGTPCFRDNMNVMNTSGVTIYLDVPVEELLRRLEADKSDDRPLLAEAQNRSERLKELLSRRLKDYRKAKVQVSGAQITAAQLLTILSDKKPDA